jgi:hypothetical protein
LPGLAPVAFFLVAAGSLTARLHFLFGKRIEEQRLPDITWQRLDAPRSEAKKTARAAVWLHFQEGRMNQKGPLPTGNDPFRWGCRGR